MTIEHQTDPSITELGDNKVMKQNLDDAFISAFVNNEVKPNFLYDGFLYLIRIIYGICGFVVYFNYKDYFSGKEMILMLSIIYYVLCAVDYVYSYLVIRDAFLIGSLPVGSKYSNATDFRATSVCNFGDYDYKLTISAKVNEKIVSYEFVKPIGSYFTESGTLVRKVVNSDCEEIMEKFRQLLKESASKKNK